MAEALLRRLLDEKEIPARVGSAGFLAAGWPATDEAIASMADEHLDLTGHRSRTVTSELVAESDLVLAMTRQHVVDLALLSPDCWSRVFQLKDLVRRAERAASHAESRSFGPWLEAVSVGRTTSGLLSQALADDIADPIGRGRPAYDTTREALNDLLTRLVELLAPHLAST